MSIVHCPPSTVLCSLSLLIVQFNVVYCSLLLIVDLHLHFSSLHFRFSVFGFCCLGPAMYAWVRLANAMWPRSDIRSALCKAYTEQVAYDPLAIVTFLFLMTLMEGGTSSDAKREVITTVPLIAIQLFPNKTPLSFCFCCYCYHYRCRSLCLWLCPFHKFTHQIRVELKNFSTMLSEGNFSSKNKKLALNDSKQLTEEA